MLIFDQGCYDAVNRQRQRSSTDKQIWNTTVTELTTKTNSSYESIGKGYSKDVLVPITIGVLILFLGVAVTVVVVIFCKRKHWKYSKDEEIALKPLLIKSSILYKERHNRECKKGEFEEEIRRGRVLLESLPGEDVKMTAKREQKKNDADSFLLAYKDVEEYFAKTGVFEESVKSLEDNGIAILIGPQGSGKTFTAACIMFQTYESWTKIKFTSWEDFLKFELEKNTLVYVDNLLDGYMYQHELRKWWCSLCYFYFERIQPEKNHSSLDNS